VPVYEYACLNCKKFVSVLVRRIGDESKQKCPECGSVKIRRVISGFAFHQSILSKLDQLDPKYDKMIDAASPDLSFDNLVKKYKLDQPLKKDTFKKDA
jgi:putative FmdB family regulatory protein